MIQEKNDENENSKKAFNKSLNVTNPSRIFPGISVGYM